MANQWLRLWHDMPTDPKWRTIARVSGQRIGDVMAVYVHMLVTASNATERGRTQSFSCEDVAIALDLDTEQVTAIVDAMQGRVLDGDMLQGWEKRQVAREDGAAERAKPRASKKCPPDYVVPDAVKAWAREHAPRLDVDEQAAAMRDHTFATARTDWDGTLRNWLRKAAASHSSVKPFQTAKERDTANAEQWFSKSTGGLLGRLDMPEIIEMEATHAAQIGNR
jgi:hypothetical protein